MSSSVLLLAFAVLGGTLAAAALERALWPRMAPRLGMAAWQVLAASVILSLSAAGLALVSSLSHTGDHFAAVLALCAESVRHGHAPPAASFGALAGIAASAAVLLRTVWCAMRVLLPSRRKDRAQVRALNVLGRRDVVPGTLVIDHPAAYAFCIGGRKHSVVLTSALVATLSERELAAVLAHEHAHLRQRHHRQLLVSRALFNTLSPVFPTFRRALPLVQVYAELSADDGALRHVTKRELHDALARLIRLPAAAGTLAATAEGVEMRLDRLRQVKRTGPGRIWVTLAFGAFGVALLVPLAMTAAPAAMLLWEGLCHLA